MSLKFFHILFIALSCMLSLVVGIWAIDAYRTDGSASWIGLAAVSFGGGAFLVVYGNRFLHKMRKLGLAGLLVAGTLGHPSDLFACTVCLGSTDSLLRNGMNAGILALLGFAMFMIVSFAAFFIYLWRRARLVSQVEAGDASGMETGVKPATTDGQGEPAHA